MRESAALESVIQLARISHLETHMSEVRRTRLFVTFGLAICLASTVLTKLRADDTYRGCYVGTTCMDSDFMHCDFVPNGGNGECDCIDDFTGIGTGTCECSTGEYGPCPPNN